MLFDWVEFIFVSYMLQHIRNDYEELPVFPLLFYFFKFKIRKKQTKKAGFCRNGGVSFAVFRLDHRFYYIYLIINYKLRGVLR